jgi:hypothetical protein
MRFRFLLVLFLATTILATSASASMTTVFDPATSVIVNSTSVLSNAEGMPYDLWIYSILTSIVLLILSFVTFKHGEEGIISIATWFTSGFALFSAFNIDRIVGSGLMETSDGVIVFMEKHTLYHFDLMAWTCLLPLFVVCLLNTGRIYMNMRTMNQIARVDENES